MFLPKMTVAMFRQTECGRTVHWAWERPPVCRPVLPHGFDQVEDLLAVRAGMVLNTGGRLVDLQMLQQGLLGVIALPTGHTVVGTALGATRSLVQWPCLPNAVHTLNTRTQTFLHAYADAA